MANNPDVLTSAVLINGSLRTATSAGTFEHVNPATALAQASLPMAGVDEVDEAVTCARDALRTWAAWPPEQRRRVLTRLAALMRDDAERFNAIQTLENGMPCSIAATMTQIGADWFEYAASWADKLNGTVVPTTPGEVFDYTLSEPVGVVAVITPWNAPLGSIGMCVGPPLAAGCTVVLKPSELAAFSSIRFGELCEKAGLPPGVVNVLPGGPEAGNALVSHPGVDKVSFTGGTATGSRIAAACATTCKPLILELGGKSANLVFPDADLQRAVDASLGVISLSGQGCTVPSRLLVHEDIHDDFVPMVIAALESIAVGDPTDPGTVMGPVVSSGACERILGMVGRARNEPDAKILTGGERLGGQLADGFFIPPTVISVTDAQCEIASEEVFGPVLTVFRFGDEEEAIEIANDTVHGLAGYVQTRDLERALRVAAALDVGNVGINGGHAPASPAAPFGGVKQSGYGREGGKQGVLEFVRTKNVMIQLGT